MRVRDRQKYLGCFDYPIKLYKTKAQNDLKNGKPKFIIPKISYKIACFECGTQSEVAIEPLEGKPIYCRECFGKRARSQWHTVENIYLLYS